MNNYKGQSTIEFIIVSFFGIGFILLFIQLSFNLTGGYLVHYATYMASRTYLVYDTANKDVTTDYTTAYREAVRVFDSYNVGFFGMNDTSASLQINSENVDYFFIGAYYKYEQPLSIFDYLGGGIKSELYSESFLGKEPTRVECWYRIRKAMDGLGIEGKLATYTTIFDNGC